MARGGRRRPRPPDGPGGSGRRPATPEPEPDPEPTLLDRARKWEEHYSHRRAYYRVKYGLDPEQHAQLYNAQRGCCFICEQERPLVVDHNHRSGKVRGLLCANCNSALGLLGDNKANLERAIEYLGTVYQRRRRAKMQYEIERRTQVGKRGERAT